MCSVVNYTVDKSNTKHGWMMNKFDIQIITEKQLNPRDGVCLLCTESWYICTVLNPIFWTALSLNVNPQ